MVSDFSKVIKTFGIRFLCSKRPEIIAIERPRKVLRKKACDKFLLYQHVGLSWNANIYPLHVRQAVVSQRTSTHKRSNWPWSAIMNQFGVRSSRKSARYSPNLMSTVAMTYLISSAGRLSLKDIGVRLIVCGGFFCKRALDEYRFAL